MDTASPPAETEQMALRGGWVLGRAATLERVAAALVGVAGIAVTLCRRQDALWNQAVPLLDGTVGYQDCPNRTFV